MSKAIRWSVAALTMCFAMAAGAQSTSSSSSPSSSSSSSSSFAFSGTALKQTLTCSGNTEVSIKGASNDITVTGECKSVKVLGSANKVMLDTVGEITVTGAANAVTWKKASGNAEKPKVYSTGTANTVSQEK